MVEVLLDVHARSRFVGVSEVDQPYTRKLLAQAIQRNGGQHDGGSLVLVNEDDDGQINAFLVGVLDRIYHIMADLRAQDMFLVARANAPVNVGRKLLDAYFDWAQGNPAVREIYLSHTDVLPDSDRIGRLYERMGFTQCGAIFRRDAAQDAARSAA